MIPRSSGSAGCWQSLGKACEIGKRWAKRRNKVETESVRIADEEIVEAIETAGNVMNDRSEIVFCYPICW
jgi:hypothetical protein